MMRTLRAELESQISAFAPAEIERMTEIETGLGALLTTGAAFQAASVVPYQPVAPGLWVGLDPDAGDCSVALACKTLHPHDPQDDRQRVARLSLNPVFPLPEKPKWVTLECAVDLAGLRKADSLRIDLISFFAFAPTNTTPIPRIVTLNLRLHRPDGSTTDHLGYRVPMSSMPFEHSVRFPAAALATIDLASATDATLIFELPHAGEYTFHVDHFSLLAVGA